MSMKDEILEAVALAIADVRKAHEVEAAGLRDEIAALKELVATVTAADGDAIATIWANTQKALEVIVTEGQVQSIFAPLFERLETLEEGTERSAAELRDRLDNTQAVMEVGTKETVDTLVALHSEVQEAKAAALTEGQFQSLVALLIERLDAAEMAAEQFATKEALKETREAVDELDFALKGYVLSGDVTKLLTPLRETLNAHTESLEGLVTMDGLDHELTAALEPIQEAMAELKTVVDGGLSEEMVQGMAEDAVAPVRAQVLELKDALQQYALQEDLDFKIDLVATQAKADYATKAEVDGAIQAVKEWSEAGDAETQQQLSAIQESVRGVDDIVAARLDDLPSGVTPEQLDAALEPLRLAQGILDDLVQSRATPEQVQKAQEETVAQIQAALVQRYAEAEAWARGGPGYQQHALVTHRSGLWQAWRRTHEEPGAGQDWQLLVDGVAGGAFGPSDLEGHSTLALEMTSGRRLEMQVRQPVPVYRGVYTQGETYAPWETVSKDERVFLCLQDTDKAPGEVAGEWQVFTGPPGRKGRNAPPVDEQALAQRVASDVLRQLVPQIQDVVDHIQ